MDHNKHIAIAGAGIGGLAAATMLARAGHRVTVFDQFEAPRPIGSGLMLQETGLAVLGELGLRADMTALGSRIDRLFGKTEPSGRTVLDVRYKAMRKDLAGLAVQRPALFNLLLRAALDAGAQLQPDITIAAADAQAGTITCANGRVIGPFDLVIDGLGVRSPLSSAPRRDLPFGALWATIPWDDGAGFDPRALEQRYRGAHQMTGVMASGRLTPDAPVMATYFWSIRTRDEAAWRKQSLDAWKDEAAALWPITAPLLSHIHTHDDLTFARYRHRTHRRPIAGPRLVHIGDSWHAASPQLGQGANMALLDAYALCQSIARADDVPSALGHYKRLRAGHVRLYQLMSWAFTPVYQSDSRALPVLRDWFAAPLSRIWPAPAFLAAMVSGAVGRPIKKLGLSKG